MDAFAPYEDATRRQAAERRRAEAANRALETAVSLLMSHAEGRSFLRWLLDQCRVFCAEDLASGPGDATARLLFTEGRRLVGMRLLRLLQQADAAHLPQLLQTKEESHGTDIA